MSRNTSIFLDIFRFIAAAVVYFGHLNDWSGKQIPVFDPFLSAQAVIIFFVLSGYVIAYVTDVREGNFRLYSVNRISRIYSVALPALLLTFAVDALSAPLPNVHIDNLNSAGFTVQFLSGLFFLNEVWGKHIPVGSNTPYWSLGYEVPYYIFFGCFLFLKGYRKLLSLVAFVIFGPRVALLGLIWLMGVAAYHISKANIVGRQLGLSILLASGLLWIMLIISGGPDYPLFWRKLLDLPKDYLSGALFSAILIGVNAALSDVKIFIEAHEKIIRRLAGMTFSLYLMHSPISQFINVFMPVPITSYAGMFILTMIVFILTFFVTEATEIFKNRIKRWLMPAPASRYEDAKR